MEHFLFVLFAALMGWAFAMAALELAYVVITQRMKGPLLVLYFFIVGIILWTFVTVASPTETSNWGIWEMVNYRPSPSLHTSVVWGGAVIAALQFFLFGPKESRS